jgi:DNA-binding NarL/FixJ family response regulator
VDVLIVDDNELVAASLQRLFQHEGLEVAVADRCASALAVTQNVRFSVAVIDVQLTDGSGIELARRLLADDRIGRVVIYTGDVWNPAVIEGAANVGRLCRKGGPMHELRGLVHQALKWEPCESGVTRIAGTDRIRAARRASGSDDD